MKDPGIKRVLSGMRPTGRLHLGHLHGVLQNWKDLQDRYSCFFFVADWHALTTNYENPQGIPENIGEMVADWLSVGIDPEKSTLFVQSRIKEHAELHLLLSMITPVSWLERNPTYKDQQQQIQDKDLATYGFLGYPVLQSADIIMYKANLVPVGVDQVPHVELTREITRRFNYLYREVFPVPEVLLTEVPKLPGLDGRKMSKSYGNAIFLSDPPDVVREKISGMVTDIERPRRSDPGDPENRCVAFHFHRLYLSEERIREIVEECKAARLGCVACKRELAEAVVRKMAPIRERRESYLRHPGRIEEILAAGSDAARSIAKTTMSHVEEALWGRCTQ
ncbi:MAG: tryptophan--tRNA ligase [Deltaproteobacteria bacterium]